MILVLNLIMIVQYNDFSEIVHIFTEIQAGAGGMWVEGKGKLGGKVE